MKSVFWRSFLVRHRLTKYFPKLHAELKHREAVASRYSARTLATPLDRLLDPALFASINTPGTIDLASAMPSPTCESLRLNFTETGREHHLGNLGLRNRIAERLNYQFAFGFSGESHVLVTHGASGAWGAFLDAWIDAGDSVAIFEPGSPLFRTGLEHRRAKIRSIPVWSEAGSVRFDSGQLRNALKGVKCLVMCDPVNPTGATWAAEEWEQLAFWIQKNDILVYLDASFANWRYDGVLRTPLGAFESLQNRLCIAGGLSGAEGHTSLRVGWFAGPELLREPVVAAQNLSSPFVSSAPQSLARSILDTDRYQHEERAQEYSNRRLWVSRRLQAMGLQPTWPGGGLWMWVELPDTIEPSRTFAQNLLDHTGVLVQPGEIFGPKCERYFRLNYTLDEGRLLEGLNRVAQYLAQLDNPMPEPTPAEIRVIEHTGETFDQLRDSTNTLGTLVEQRSNQE